MIDRSTILRTFLAEAEERLLIAEDAAIMLEQHSGDAELFSELFRAIHTVKGDADSLAFAETTVLAHSLEDLLDAVRGGAITLKSPIVTLILDCIDALRDAIERIRSTGTDAGRSSEELRARLRTTLTEAARTAQASAKQGDLSTGSGEAPMAIDRADMARVNVALLEGAMDACLELSLALVRLRPLTQKGPRTDEVLNQIESLMVDLQDRAASLRLVPARELLRGLGRTVRDLSAALGKEVRFAVEGVDVTVDGNVIERLREPLGHLVRNALDHGLEPPEERTAQGKSPCGKLSVRLRRTATGLMVDVTDDGRGIDPNRLRARAVELGLLSANAELPDDILLDLVFEAGLSTAATVSDISGRGVGMDAVRRSIQELRGTVQVQSRKAEGTTVSLRVPVSLSLLDGFGVGVSGEHYILPQDCVLECLALPPNAKEDEGVVDVRGEPLPFVRLRRLFRADLRNSLAEALVIIECAGKRLGLVVDELFGEARSVIRPLGPVFRSVRYLSGCTMLESGALGLVLDVNALYREALVGTWRRNPAQPIQDTP